VCARAPNLEHFLVDADVGVGLEVGHVVVGAGRRRGMRRRRRGGLVRRGPRAPDAPRPARVRARQVAVAVGTAGEHRGFRGGKGVSAAVACGLPRVGRGTGVETANCFR
jgi:hypothetical protein